MDIGRILVVAKLKTEGGRLILRLFVDFVFKNSPNASRIVHALSEQWNVFYIVVVLFLGIITTLYLQFVPNFAELQYLYFIFLVPAFFIIYVFILYNILHYLCSSEQIALCLCIYLPHTYIYV